MSEERPPYLWHQFEPFLRGKGAFVFRHYFSMSTRHTAIDLISNDIFDLQKDVPGSQAAAALEDLRRGLHNTTDDEYLWIARKVRSLPKS